MYTQTVSQTQTNTYIYTGTHTHKYIHIHSHTDTDRQTHTPTIALSYYFFSCVLNCITFLIAVTKSLDRKNLREKELTLAYGLRRYSPPQRSLWKLVVLDKLSEDITKRK